MPIPECLEWCLRPMDDLQLRDIYGHAKGKLPPSVLELCVYCYVLMFMELCWGMLS